MEPATQTEVAPSVQTAPAVTKKLPRQRHFLAVFFISFMWGPFAIDRFYLGKWGTGILKLVTFGGFGFWVLVDLALIMSGAMKDKQGREMLQVAEYKKFAAKTVLWFAVILGAAVLLGGLLLILGVYEIITLIQDGGLENIPGIGAGLNALTGGSEAGQVQEILNSN